MEITRGNYEALFRIGNLNLFELNSKLTSKYGISSLNLDYLSHGHNNIVFSIKDKQQVFRVSKKPFYQHNEGVSPVSSITSYLLSFVKSVAVPQVKLAQNSFNKRQRNVTFTKLSELKKEEIIKISKQIEGYQKLVEDQTTSNNYKSAYIVEIQRLNKDKSSIEAFYESVPQFLKEDGKSHGRAYLEHLSSEKIIPELISMGFFVLRLNGHFCFYEYSISEKGIGLKKYLRDNPELSEDDIKTLCVGIQDILNKLVRLQIEFDIKVSNFVVVKDLSSTIPKYVPRIIDVEIGNSSLPSIESELRKMFKQDKTEEDIDIYKFIVMFQLFQLKLNFKHDNHKNLRDFPLLSEYIDWYLNLWENRLIVCKNKYIGKLLKYFHWYFSGYYAIYKNKKKKCECIDMNVDDENKQKYCDNYYFYLKHLIDKNFNYEEFEDYDDNPLEKPVPVVNTGGSKTKKTKRVKKNKSMKRKNKSKKRKLII